MRERKSVERVESQRGSMRTGRPGWWGQITKSRYIRLWCLGAEGAPGGASGWSSQTETNLRTNLRLQKDGSGYLGEGGGQGTVTEQVVVARTRVKGDGEKGRQFKIQLESRVMDTGQESCPIASPHLSQPFPLFHPHLLSAIPLHFLPFSPVSFHFFLEK